MTPERVPGLVSAVIGVLLVSVVAPVPLASAETTSLSIVAEAYRQTVMADAPLGYWPLDDAAGALIVRDEMGRTPGSADGGVALGVAPGPVPGTTALRLDGAGCSGIDLSQGAATLSPQTLSIEAWVRTQATDPVMTVFRRRFYGFLFGAGSAGVYFGTADTALTAPAPVADGAWHHVAAVVEVGAQARVYFDGLLVGEVPFPYGLYYGGSQTAIGRDGGACDDVVQSWDGDLAHVAVYNHALSAQRMVEHARVESPPATPVLTGGTSIALPPSGVGEKCTAGFAVVSAANRTLMSTAGHCRLDNTNIPNWRTVVDVLPLGEGDGAVFDPTAVPYATALRCDGTSYRCLVPGPKAKNQDMMAFEVNNDVAISTLVKTGEGLLPNLGADDWRKGEYVCRWGRTTAAEKCGYIDGFYGNRLVLKDGPGLVRMGGDLGRPGDSGGPVYRKVLGADGKAIGVQALGISIQMNDDPKKGKVGTYFLPIRTLEKELGVRVLATSPP